MHVLTHHKLNLRSHNNFYSDRLNQRCKNQIIKYTANLYRDYREFTGITCTLYRVFPVTGKNL